jgi:hypothetical protein
MSDAPSPAFKPREHDASEFLPLPFFRGCPGPRLFPSIPMKWRPRCISPRAIRSPPPRC